MINMAYLLIFLIGGAGSGSVTSQVIPQANMAQCQANAKIFNSKPNIDLVYNGLVGGYTAQKAVCIVGVMEK